MTDVSSTTTVQVSRSTKARLFDLKECEADTYDDVINQVLDDYERDSTADAVPADA